MAISNLTTGLRPGVCTSLSRPTAPYEGQVIYETDTDLLRIWNGSAWKNIAATTPANGSILQVQSTTYVTPNSTTSGSMVDTPGMAVSITPTSSTSKVFVQVKMQIGYFQADDVYFNLQRNGTNIAQGTGATANYTLVSRGYLGGGYGDTNVFTVATDFLDSPATTASVIYKMQWATRVGTVFINRRGNDSQYSASSTITVMEIAA